MDIETANRLYEYRKKSGLSQEELADKLGLSRQAVSKWERAEASPDTDNLIALAKIYNCTLDELLNASKDVNINKEEKEDKKISVSRDGIVIKDDEGSVHIDNNGIRVHEKGGDHVVIDGTGIHINEKHNKIPNIIDGICLLVALTSYLLLGFLPNTAFYASSNHPFAVYWVLFLLALIPGSIAKAIISKKAKHVNIVFLVTAIYCFFGLGYGYWHPLWIVFLAIPIYYTLCKVFQPHADDDDDEDDEDDDEEEEKEEDK